MDFLFTTAVFVYYKHKKFLKYTDIPIHNCFNRHFLLANTPDIFIIHEFLKKRFYRLQATNFTALLIVLRYLSIIETTNRYLLHPLNYRLMYTFDIKLIVVFYTIFRCNFLHVVCIRTFDYPGLSKFY